MTGFGARLAEAKSRRGPLCLGIDPHPELLGAWGLPTTADGLAAFCDTCVEAYAGFAVVKPQVAFFEATCICWPKGEKGAVMMFSEMSLLATLATSKTRKPPGPSAV